MTPQEQHLIQLAESKIAERKVNAILADRISPNVKEIGATGTSIWSGVVYEEYQADLKGSKKFKIYDKMKSDSQVMATLLVVELPIRAAEWDIKAAENGTKSDEIAAFVHDALLNAGAMSITWDDFIRQALLMYTYGFMLFEICYKLQNGSVVWQKFAPRMPNTVYCWLTDDEGGYAGFQQQLTGDMATKKGSIIDIPAEKTLRFTHRQEGSNFEGTSFLRWIYKNWWYKDLLYKLAGMCAERTGVGTPVITLPKVFANEDRVIAKGIVESWRANEEAGVVLPPDYELEISVGKPFGYLPLIEHHDKQISKGILAQFLNLGQDKVGSYALSETHYEIFSQSLEAVAKNLCDIINTYAIPRLVQMNYDTDQFPILFCTLPKNTKAIIEAAKNLTDAMLLTPDTELEEYMRNLMDLPPKPEEEKETETHEEAHDDVVRLATKEGPGEPFWRPLNRWEDKKNLKLLNDNWNQLEFDFQRGITDILDKQRDDLIRQVELAMERASFKQLLEIAPRYGEELRGYIKSAFIATVDFAREQVADEVNLPKQELATRINQWINARSEMTSQQIQNDMRWEMVRRIFNRKELLSEISEGAVGAQTIKQITRQAYEAVEDYKSRALTVIGRAVVGEGIRTGRDTIVQHPDITLAMRSEILDGNTCANCARLDGYTTQFNSENYAKYSPPQFCFGGNNCRGVWIYIKKDETPQPEVTKEQPRLEEIAFSEGNHNMMI